MLRLRLDGQDIAIGDHSPLDGAELTLRQEDVDGRLAYSFAGAITLYGDAYKLVYEKLVNFNGITPMQGVDALTQAFIYVDVWDDCCIIGVDDLGNPVYRVLFPGEIDYKSVKWCENQCSLDCEITERSPYAQSVNCLQSVRPWDDLPGRDRSDPRNFRLRRHPFVRHCTEGRPRFAWDALMLIAFIIGIPLSIALAVLAIVVTIINVIIDVINIIIDVVNSFIIDPDDKIARLEDIGNGDTNFFDDIFGPDGWIPKLFHLLFGCQYGHPAPFVRDYVQNICALCGLGFQSSILNTPTQADGTPNPYYNLMWFEAPVDKGSSEYVNWIDDNKTLLTGHDLLMNLAQVFNAWFRIKDGVLIFERRDYFQSGELWLDVSIIDDPRVVSICYEYKPEPDPSYASFEYTQDGVDWIGNEAKALYNDMVDWNLPFGDYPRLKGERKYLLPFAPARFRDDGIHSNFQDDWYAYISAVNEGLADYLFDERFNNAMLLPADITFTPKLLIWDGVSSIENARVMRAPQQTRFRFRFSHNVFFGITYPIPVYYNQPLWFTAPVDGSVDRDAQVTDKPYYAGNLYEKFFYIDDPRRYPLYGLQYTLTLLRSCEILDGMDMLRMVKLPPLPNGLARIGRVSSVSIGETEIKIQGTL